MSKSHVKKGDKVIVISGKDKGKISEVLQVLPKESRVVVQGVNVMQKHQRPTAGDPGGKKPIEKSIHISNVMHIDPKDNKRVRVGFKVNKDGSKVRVAKRSGEAIDN
ncbi:MAG: 50S ribosomal protein L24 [Candidatus Nucleicultricaceae bacterium]